MSADSSARSEDSRDELPSVQRLVRGGGAAGVRAERARAVATMLGIGLSIGVAWVNTSAAKYCWLLLAVAPWAVDRWSSRRQPA
jgi:hypothetical protein